MDKFLLNIEKYKFAILGTLIVHLFIVVGSSFQQVQHVMRIPPQDVEIEMPLEDIEFEPEIAEILELNKAPLPSENLTNVVADENDTREKSYEDYSTNENEVEEDVMQSALDLQDQYFKEAAANNPISNQTQQESHVPIETTSDKIKVPPTETLNGKSGSNAFAGEAIISYNLKGRKAFKLPNPGYTCSTSGTIVIEIKVGSDGTVRSTNFMSNSSSGATACLIERAQEYASRARFNYSDAGTQTGTITYKFRSK